MYSTSQPVSSSMNGIGGNMMDDGTGTINPAALNSGVPVLPTPASTNASNLSPRGVKRSRSPEQYTDSQGNTAEDEQRRKRGRPPKSRLSGGENELPNVHPSQQNAQQPSVGQVHAQPQPMPQQAAAPPQASPPKPAPPKTVVKALPTVRDHTTDQLTPEGDEYIPREYDEAGEKKVTPTGRPLEGREYKCRTFLVPNRGDKLFMLATECARVLGYRDSYLLFNKNRSLFKIIATQAEKDDLIGQEILPYSYRSRQIAIVTAKSMFRQFGSRVITNGRRVRDDYWEAKARKQGFTEDDLAGEKRPGGSKAREQQAAEAAHAAAALGHSQDVVYSSGPGHVPIDAHGHPQLMQAGMGSQMGQNLAPQLPMISLTPQDDLRLREYSNVPRPRQEITGQPYQDRSQPSSMAEIMNHATHGADFSKALNQQQRARSKQLDDFWKQSREAPASAQQPEPTTMAQAGQMPQNAAMGPGQQPIMSHQNSQILPQAYQQQPGAGHQNASQSPARNMQQPHMRADQQQQHQQQQAGRPGSMPYGSSLPQSSYGYGAQAGQQMWAQHPGQPHQSPMAPHHGMAQYSPQPQQHPNQSPHPSQSPHQHHPAQPPPPGGVQHGQAGMAYQGMPQGMPQGYGMQGRGIYAQSQPQQQHSPTPHGYVQQTSGAGGASPQVWAQPPGQQAGHNGQSWSNY